MRSPRGSRNRNPNGSRKQGGPFVLMLPVRMGSCNVLRNGAIGHPEDPAVEREV